MASSAYHLKPAEVRKLFIAAPNFRDRCILKSLYWLGLRRQELIDLDIRDLDFDRKRVQVREGKGGKTRIIPIIAEEYLSDLIQHLNPHIFRHSIARWLKSQGFTAEWIQNFLGHQSYKTTMDLYGTISIDEMQETAKLSYLMESGNESGNSYYDDSKDY